MAIKKYKFKNCDLSENLSGEDLMRADAVIDEMKNKVGDADNVVYIKLDIEQIKKSKKQDFKLSDDDRLRALFLSESEKLDGMIAELIKLGAIIMHKQDKLETQILAFDGIHDKVEGELQSSFKSHADDLLAFKKDMESSISPYKADMQSLKKAYDEVKADIVSFSKQKIKYEKQKSIVERDIKIDGIEYKIIMNKDKVEGMEKEVEGYESAFNDRMKRIDTDYTAQKSKYKSGLDEYKRVEDNVRQITNSKNRA